MANNYQQHSFMIDSLTPAEAYWLNKKFDENKSFVLKLLLIFLIRIWYFNFFFVNLIAEYFQLLKKV